MARSFLNLAAVVAFGLVALAGSPALAQGIGDVENRSVVGSWTVDAGPDGVLVFIFKADGKLIMGKFDSDKKLVGDNQGTYFFIGGLLEMYPDRKKVIRGSLRWLSPDRFFLPFGTGEIEFRRIPAQPATPARPACDLPGGWLGMTTMQGKQVLVALAFNANGEFAMAFKQDGKIVWELIGRYTLQGQVLVLKTTTGKVFHGEIGILSPDRFRFVETDGLTIVFERKV